MRREQMGERFSIYAGEPLLRLISETGGENRSGRINDVAARFEAILDDELKRLNLTEGEWCAVMDANNGTFMHDDIGWRHSWVSVMDMDEDMDTKWSIDTEGLVRKLRGLSIAGQAAVAEVIERFWGGEKPRKAKSYPEQLRAAGAYIDAARDSK